MWVNYPKGWPEHPREAEERAESGGGSCWPWHRHRDVTSGNIILLHTSVREKIAFLTFNKAVVATPNLQVALPRISTASSSLCSTFGHVFKWKSNPPRCANRSTPLHRYAEISIYRIKQWTCNVWGERNEPPFKFRGARWGGKETNGGSLWHKTAGPALTFYFSPRFLDCA